MKLSKNKKTTQKEREGREDTHKAKKNKMESRYKIKFKKRKKAIKFERT